MINGIDYLKKMYPDRDDKDYQPSGLDLRLGKVFELDSNQPLNQRVSPYGIYGGKKYIPKYKEMKTVKMNGYDVWELYPDEPYICQGCKAPERQGLDR